MIAINKNYRFHNKIIRENMNKILKIGLIIMILNTALNNILNAEDNSYPIKNRNTTSSNNEVSMNKYADNTENNTDYSMTKQQIKTQLNGEFYMQFGLNAGTFAGSYKKDDEDTEILAGVIALGYGSFELEAMVGNNSFEYIALNYQIYNFVSDSHKYILSPYIGLAYWKFEANYPTYPNKDSFIPKYISTTYTSNFPVVVGIQYRYLLNDQNSIVSKLTIGETANVTLAYRYVFNNLKNTTVTSEHIKK